MIYQDIKQLDKDIQVSAKFLQENKDELNRAKNLLSLAKKQEKVIRDWGESIVQTGESVTLTNGDLPIISIDTRKSSGICWEVNYKCLQALLSCAETTGSVLKKFALKFVSREGTSQKVRDSIEETFSRLQTNGHAGKARVHDVEPIFIPAPNSKSFAATLQVL